MEEQVLEFSVSALEGREWLDSRPWRFTLSKTHLHV